MVYHIDVVDPTPADVVGYSPGDEWENTVKVTYFRLYAIVGGLADWRQYTKPVLKEQRLSGDNPLSYLGVEPCAPFKFVRCSRNPTTRDNSLAGFNIGDEWENEFTGDVWKLVDVSNNIGTWVLMGAAVGVATELRPNVGPLAAPDITHAINLLGGTLMYTISLPNTIEVNHNAMATGQVIIGATAPAHAAMNRITQGTNIVVDDLAIPGAITLRHEAPDGFTNLIDNAATVVPFDPATHGISVLGTVGIRTYRDPANVNRLIISTERANNGELFTGRTGDVPLWKVLNPGVNVGVVNQPGMITLTSSVAGGDVTFVGDTNVATSVGGVMDFVGGANINTVGDTVQEIDINLKDFITLPNTNAIGDEGLFSLGALPNPTPFVSNYNNNVFLGGAGSFLLNGTGNTMIGIDGGSVLTTGSDNTSIGQNALDSLTTGSSNIGIGEAAGTAITTEDSNIFINNDGVAADTHTLRIGDQLSPDKSLANAYIDGIYQAPVDYSTAEVVINDANDKLGSISMSDLRNLIPVSGIALKVVTTLNDTFVLLSDGSVWGTGSNIYGQLGVGDTNQRPYFTKMLGEGSSGVDDISAGRYHVALLKGDRVYTCGYNRNLPTGSTERCGQLGINSTIQYVSTPVAMLGEGSSGVDKVSCGEWSTLLLKGDAVFGCGGNSFGELGDGTRNTSGILSRLVPVASVGAGSYGVDDMEAFGNNTFILKGGAVFGCGYDNQSGILGIGNPMQFAVPNFTAAFAPANAGVTQLAKGRGAYMVISKSGALFSTGLDNYGGTGTGAGGTIVLNRFTPMIGFGTAGATDIAVGYGHTIVNKSGVGYSCGRNLYVDIRGGTLGDGTITNRNQLVHMINDGTSGITAISAGGWSHTVVIKNGLVYGTGIADKFGVGATDPYTFFTQLTPVVQTW